MSDQGFASLEIRGPIYEDEFEIWEAVDESSPKVEDHVYSCIALCRKDWYDEWAALGGTRWIESEADPETGKAQARHQATELAMSMYIKNSVLRKAAHAVLNGDSGLFDWQGGKGVIWTPPGAALTEHRLRCHGRLIERLHGRYYGSKDAGVATKELETIDQETRFTIGLESKRDTGEGTARGVFSGLQQALRELGGAPDGFLRDVPVLVIGAGKVGLPLIGLLHQQAGAKVYVFDDHLEASPDAVEEWYQRQVERGAAIDESHRRALQDILEAGRLFSKDQEEEALRQAEIQIVSPNGGPTEWLSRKLTNGQTRAEVLAENRRRNGNLRLILGAGNDQVSTTEEGKGERDRALAVLAESGICFVPDPLVSPGGVIAVSHERTGEWHAERVNEDATLIVRRSVEQVFRQARRMGGTDARTLYRAFEEMLQESEWN